MALRGAPARARPRGASVAEWDYWWNQNSWEILGALARERILPRETRRGGVDPAIPGSAWEARAARLGQLALPLLRAAAQDRDPLVRAAALVALGKTRIPVCLLDLRSALSDSDEDVRSAAVLGLGLLGRPEVLDHLRALARDSAAGRALAGGQKVATPVREMAAFALGLVPDARARAHLVELAEAPPSPDPQPRDLRTIAIAALGIHGDSTVVPLLGRILTDANRPERERAAAAVSLAKTGDRGPVVVRMLEGALQDRKAVVVQGAAIGLGLAARPSDRMAISALASVVHRGPDLQARGMALLALGRIGGDVALDLCTHELQPSGPLSGYAAVAAGLAAGGTAPERLATLAAKAGDPKVRAAALLGLGLAGDRREAARLVQALVSAATGEERAMAASALALLGHRPAADDLRRALATDGDPILRHHAALGLGLLHDPDAAVADLLEVLATEHNPYVSAAGSLAIGWCGDEAAVAGLGRLLDPSQPSREARRFAAGALGLLADSRARGTLHAFRAGNLYHLDVPGLRRVLLFL